jgi:hypothetical protein
MVAGSADFIRLWRCYFEKKDARIRPRRVRGSYSHSLESVELRKSNERGVLWLDLKAYLHIAEHYSSRVYAGKQELRK